MPRVDLHSRHSPRCSGNLAIGPMPHCACRIARIIIHTNILAGDIKNIRNNISCYTTRFRGTLRMCDCMHSSFGLRSRQRLCETVTERKRAKREAKMSVTHHQQTSSCQHCCSRQHNKIPWRRGRTANTSHRRQCVDTSQRVCLDCTAVLTR